MDVSCNTGVIFKGKWARLAYKTTVCIDFVSYDNLPFLASKVMVMLNKRAWLQSARQCKKRNVGL